MSISLRKGENTRIRIVDRAYGLFLEQGYHGTSMRQIADATGITVGGIYNHFAGKEAIWEEVVAAKHPAREILPLLHEAQGTTIAEFVRAAAAGMVEALGHRPDFLKLMFIEIVEFNAKHVPGLFQAVMPEVTRLGRTFAEKQGTLRPLPKPLLARSFVGLFFSYYVTALFLPPEMQQGGENALSAFVDIYLHGILDEEGDARA